MNEDKLINDEMTLEEAFLQLDEVASQMQEEGRPLEEIFALYKKGISLVEMCNRKIERVECDIRKLEAGDSDD